MTKKSTMTLKPGILVSLKTSKRGGVEYKRKDITRGDEAAPAEEGEAALSVEKWETTKIVADKAEDDRATKARSRVGGLIRSVCTTSAFGLICPETKEKELDEAIAEARATVAVFNETAVNTNIAVYVLKGRIASTDDEAARAIASELRELMDDMRDGIGAGDVEAAREAASKAKKMGAMLDEATTSKVTKAIDEVRAAAKEIAKRVVAGEDRAAVVKSIKLEELEKARFAFIDMSEPVAVESLPPTAARPIDVSEDDDGSVTPENPVWGRGSRELVDLSEALDDDKGEPRLSAAAERAPEIEV
jgi:hypothetical protein